MELKLGWLNGDLDLDLDLWDLESFQVGSGTCLLEYTSTVATLEPDPTKHSQIPAPAHAQQPAPAPHRGARVANGSHFRARPRETLANTDPAACGKRNPGPP